MKKVKIKHNFHILMFTYLIIVGNCKRSSEPYLSDKPIANAGKDKEISVGQYVILDGSKSVFGD